jgi:hypothetical protein
MVKSPIIGLDTKTYWLTDRQSQCDSDSDSLTLTLTLTLTHLRLPQPGGPGSRIYIPREQGGPVIPLGTGLKLFWYCPLYYFPTHLWFMFMSSFVSNCLELWCSFPSNKNSSSHLLELSTVTVCKFTRHLLKLALSKTTRICLALEYH